MSSLIDPWEKCVVFKKYSFSVTYLWSVSRQLPSEMNPSIFLWDNNLALVEVIKWLNDTHLLTSYLQKADSGDSGNEEPNAEDDFYVKREDHAVEAASRILDRVYLPPPVPKTDKLVERINNLSNPRDYCAEKVPEGLVDSLPPEGSHGSGGWFKDLYQLLNQELLNFYI